MSEHDPYGTDLDVAVHALSMWKNYIETGSVNLSAQDAANQDRQDEVRPLNDSQYRFLVRLEDIKTKIQTGVITDNAQNDSGAGTRPHSGSPQAMPCTGQCGGAGICDREGSEPTPLGTTPDRGVSTIQ